MEIRPSAYWLATVLLFGGIGLVFFAAYLYGPRNRFLRMVIFFCEELSFPSGRKAAMMYSVVCLFIVMVAVLTA